MKKIILVVLLITGYGTMAQPAEGGERIEKLKEVREMMKNLSPEQVATLKTKQLTLELNLSEHQQEDIYNMELEIIKERKAKHEEMKEKKEKGELDNMDEDELFKRMNERLDNKIAHKKEMSEILDQEQFQKWERLNKRKHMMKKKMRHGKTRRPR